MLHNVSARWSETYLESSEMNHTVDILMRLKDLVEGTRLGDINVVKFGPLAADELDTIDCLL